MYKHYKGCLSKEAGSISIKEILALKMNKFQKLVTEQIQKEDNIEHANELAATSRILISMGGFTKVLRSIGISLSYNDMCKFSSSSSKTAKTATRGNQGVTIDVTSFVKHYQQN
jgi:hypothetical protein